MFMVWTMYVYAVITHFSLGPVFLHGKVCKVSGHRQFEGRKINRIRLQNLRKIGQIYKNELNLIQVKTGRLNFIQLIGKMRKDKLNFFSLYV